MPPVVTVDPPVHTRTVGNVKLTTNEHATIYYTSDGSLPTTDSTNEPDLVLLPNMPDDAVVSFFAVDVNGNTSPVQTVKWNVDRNGPGAPMPVKLTLAGSQRTVTWTPPADPTLAGVILARVEGVQTASPTPGKKYAVGDTIGAGVTVVAASDPGGETSFTETQSAAPGLVRYVAWAFDDALNYSSGAGDYAVTTLPAQTGSVSIASATGTVTASAQPANLMFSGTATLDSASSTLQVTLNVTNTSSRTLFAPKLLLTNTLATATFDNSDGTFDTFPYRALGGAIPPGGKATTKLNFGNVTSGDTVALTLDVRDGRVLVGGHWNDGEGGSVADEATNEVVRLLAPGTLAHGGNAALHGGGVTVDGRVIMGSRNNGELVSFDIATGQRVLTNMLAQGKYNTPRLVLDPSGSAGYALLGAGHAYTARYEGVTSYLVTFDAATLQETGRLEIGPSRNRDMSLSPDGRWLAIATGLARGIIVVDLATLTIAHVITTPVVATTVTFTASSLLAAGVNGVFVFNRTDYSLDKTIGVTSGGKSFRGVIGPDGRYWVGRKNDIAAIDLATSTVTIISEQAAILESSGGKIYVGDEGDSSFQRLDMTGTSETSISLDTSVYGHWVGHSPF